MNKRLHELFSYSDGKLLWRVNRGRVHVGDEAGAAKYLGTFDSADLAQAAYAAAAKQNFKEFARV